jgi:glucose uptake protein GlcU
MKEVAHFLLRGALGGALLQLLISIVVFIAYPATDALLTLSLSLTLPVIVGAVIGGILWLVKRKSHQDNGLIKRVIIGASFATLLFAILFYSSGHGSSWSARDYLVVLVLSLFFGIEIGVPAAICARTKETTTFQQLGLFPSLPLLKQEDRVAR